MTTCIRCFIAGKVQGVWFRGNTQQQAQSFGITGYARNLADGRVEVLACGADEALNRLRQWLHRGPPNARVESVTCEPASDAPPRGFTTS